MHVRRLQLDSFRNLEPQPVELAAGFNLVLGDNGQGKTNLLEAIHLLASLRSFRAASTREMIRLGAERAELTAEVESDGAPMWLRLRLEAGGRRLWIGQRAVSSVTEYLGQLKVVAFTPDDLSMIKGGPSLRRRFLDRAIFLSHPDHLLAVRQLAVALRQRNELLASSRPFDRAEIDGFSQTLAHWGLEVTRLRAEWLGALAAGFARILAEISAGCLHGELAFKPGWRFEPRVGAERLVEQLGERLKNDRRRGSTSLGPQLDDFGVLIGGQPARRTASQGQQRAATVALLLSVFELSAAAAGSRPVVLLDDVSSELDASVRGRLFGQIAGLGGQVLVTTTDPGIRRELARSVPGTIRRLRVHAGRVAVEEDEG